MEPKKRGRPLKADAKRESLNVRMDAALLAAIKTEADRLGISPSEWLRRVAAEKLSA